LFCFVLFLQFPIPDFFFSSKLTFSELKVLIADIQKCTDVSTGQKLGEYALYDLVQLGAQNFGVIVRVDSDMAHVLEENGKVRQVRLQGTHVVVVVIRVDAIDAERQILYYYFLFCYCFFPPYV
jgi:transcription elongation factor